MKEIRLEPNCLIYKLLFHGMQKGQHSLCDNMPMDIQLCNILIHFFQNQKDWITALQLFKTMKIKGPQPNHKTYHMIITNYAHKKLWNQMLKLLDRMKETECIPTIKTYAYMIKS